MNYIRLTKTDGTKQEKIFVRCDKVSWLQGASPTALPTPETVEPDGSGAILHFAGALEHTVTVAESIDQVIRMLESED